jgi:hypothetical protein
MAKTLLTADYEDRHLRVLIARRARVGPTILSARTFALKDGDPATLAAALKAAARDVRAEATDLILTVGDRACAAGHVTQSPPPDPAELKALIASTARRIGMYSDREELTIAYRESAKGEAWGANVSVAPRASVAAIDGALRTLGFRRVAIALNEAVLAAGLSSGSGEPIAILDVRQERALLVLARGGDVLAARRIKLPFGYSRDKGSALDVGPVLAGEAMRSFQYFQDQGHPEPTRVLVTGEVGPDSHLLPAIRDLLVVPLELAAPPALAALPKREATPLRWTVPLLSAVAGLDRVPWLVEPVRRPLRITAAVAALQALGLVGLLGGGYLAADGFGREARAARALLAAEAAAVAALLDEVMMLEARLQPPPAVEDRRAILQALDQGPCSISRLCASLAADRPPDLLFKKLALHPDGRMELEGLIAAADRLAAMSQFGDLDNALGAIPGLVGGTAALEENAGGRFAFSYRAKLSGRLP